MITHMVPACVCGWLLALAAQEPRATPPRADLLLAEIPAGLSVGTFSKDLGARGRYRSCSTLAWSPDGKRVAYVAQREEDWFPVVGSKVGKAYAYVAPPVFAGSHVFFVVHQLRKASAQGTTYHCSLWVDGKTSAPEDMIWDWAVSADGQRAAYWTGPGWSTFSTEAAKPQRLVVATKSDGGSWSIERDAEWWYDPGLPPQLSEDGKRVFTWAAPVDVGEGSRGEKGEKGKKGVRLRPATASDQVVLIERGKRDVWLCQPVPRIDSLAISRSGEVQALLVGSRRPSDGAAQPPDTTELYFKMKRVGLAYQAIRMPAVDPDGKHFACVVASGMGQTVAVDDEQPLVGRYDHILELAFDPQGRHIAFIANSGGTSDEHGWVEGGESFVVVRSLAGEPALREQAHFKEVQDLVWDPLGEQVACRVRDDSGWRIAYGAALSEPHDEVGRPQFAATELGFGSRDQRELWWRSLDKNQLPSTASGR